MTAIEIAALIGQRVEVRIEMVQVECVVLDVKLAYGATRFLIQPIKGSGSQWVDISRVRRGGADSMGSSPC